MSALQSGDPANQDALVIGNDELCAWRVAPSVVWVQTRNPKHAERLRRRSDSRLVARGVAGGYLRTFEFAGKTLGWAHRLIDRYQTSEQTSTGGTPKAQDRGMGEAQTGKRA